MNSATKYFDQMMGRKIQMIFSLIIGLIVITACSDEVLNDIDSNPNVLSDAPLSSMLPQAIITYSHEVVGGSGALSPGIYAGFMSEQTTHVLGSNVYNTHDNYNSQAWVNAYRLFTDLKEMKNIAVNNEAWTYAGITDVLKAFTLTTLVDLYGDVPYSEASSDIRQPKFDSHQDLYPVIQELLDEAITNLNKESGSLVPSNDDIAFGGDKDLWIKTAYGLKARIFNKLSNLDPIQTAEDALDAIDNSFANKDENFMVSIFNDSRQNGNPLSVSQRLQPQSAVGNGIFNTMLSFTPNNVIEEDPRAEIWFTTVNGERLPAPNGTAEADFGDPRMDGAIYSKPEMYKFNEAPFPFLNYNELLFIKAEAHHRLGNMADAYSAYQEAVRLALDQAAMFNPSVDLSQQEIDNYMGYSEVSPGEQNLTRETIIRQKYIYFFQMQPVEAYNETRRVDFLPPTNPLGRPNRMVYPDEELARNPNAPSDVNFFTMFEESTKLFWAE